MPLADNCCLVSACPKQLWERLQAIVHLACERRYIVHMVICASQDSRPTGRAYRVCAETVVEAYPAVTDPVEVWRLVDPAAITTHGVGSVVVGHDEQYVRAFVFHWSILQSNFRKLPGIAGILACNPDSYQPLADMSS
jgi:hypothetical protein